MLTVNWIAKDLNVCTKTVYRRILSGELPASKLAHNCVRVSESDYATFKAGLIKSQESETK